MGKTIGILIFDGAEEMDFIGPWEVMAAAVDGLPGERVLTVAEKADPVVCEKGMRVLADTTYDEAPPLDVVLIPGGSGARCRGRAGRRSGPGASRAGSARCFSCPRG